MPAATQGLPVPSWYIVQYVVAAIAVIAILAGAGFAIRALARRFDVRALPAQVISAGFALTWMLVVLIWALTGAPAAG